MGGGVLVVLLGAVFEGFEGAVFTLGAWFAVVFADLNEQGVELVEEGDLIR